MPLRSPAPRPIGLRLLGGLLVYISTLYCGPKWRRRGGGGRGVEGAGLFPELALLGVSKGVSPGLAGEVARSVALLPSFDQARCELRRRGCELDIKVVHRCALRVGNEALTARQRDVVQWRAGQLPKGHTCAGKRVAAALDGGRTRIRERVRRQKGRGAHKCRRRGWTAQWREPKRFIIFEVDERGRKKEGTQAFVDGTFQGPDAVMELLAMRLHQLGVADAVELIFLADGATWIWNRLNAVVEKAGIRTPRVTMILDFCHALQHVHMAVGATDFDAQARQRVLKRLRRKVYQGRADSMLDELQEFRQKHCRDRSILDREIAYFERHRDHMAYKAMREAGLPMGSGAIESDIRRTVNQRLKGNGIQWNEGNAESVMYMRGMALTDRWDEMLDHARATMATNRQIDWQWSSPDMRAEDLPDEDDPASEEVTMARSRSCITVAKKSPPHRTTSAISAAVV